MNPLDQFLHDLNLARAAADPMANLCTVANVDATGQVQQRTLVLRQVDGQLAIFINATSPKWPHLQNTASLLTYWPSVQVQYRIHATTSEVAAELVKESWQLRPDAPKHLDWFYSNQAPQSSDIGDRESLLSQLARQTLPTPLIAPDTAQGLLLHPTRVERLDLTQDNGVHQRTHAILVNDRWQQTTLVP